MKISCFLIFTLFPLVASSQIVNQDSIQINEKAVNWFKSDYVQKNFKDPYSFKLVKIVNSPISSMQWLLNDIELVNKTIANYEQKKKLDKYEKELYGAAIKRRDSYQFQLQGLSSEDSNKIKCFSITLDCYGSNSYGATVLGRYSFNFFENQTPPVPYVNKIN